MNCPKCHEDIADGIGTCSACGFSFDSATQMFKSSDERGEAPSTHSTEPADGGSFRAGEILADRYRMVSLLGRGGMGEVYRADDLKLSQPVALKFLPERLVNDGAALARFHREVRVARQVSHRNVCRVYDIGEIDGRHFLSMEFIKGEELSSLLHRIGRLPNDKAIQLARQICAGLAAAHETGILHRDLKPANVMIDEHGNARITDFGLAGLAEEFKADEIGAGTPAYMSPEQIEGGELTVKSDIYSLGLVLYELFTGKQAFVAATVGELINLRRSNTSPTTPTSIVKDFDPVIEKVIDRCIQKDPSQRPSSALQVAAALPGGDPIAAALAAGETPSPEMVAAAPKEGALRPPVAIAMLAAFFVMLVAVVLVGERKLIHSYIPFERSPEVLRETARDIARRAGYSEPLDISHWFALRNDMLDYIEQNDQSPDRWDKMKAMRPSAATFRYRQSPRYLETNDGRLGPEAPPRIVPGMVDVSLDTRGELRSFRAVPPHVIDRAPTTPNEVDWSIFFTAAGLDQAEFRQAESQLTPRASYDSSIAWEGAYPENPQMPFRIEAAAFLGKAVSFQIVHSWEQPTREVATPMKTGQKVFLGSVIGLLVLAVIAGGLLTLKNMRLGRGDRRGAFRLAHFAFWTSMIRSVFFPHAHHVPTTGEFFIIMLPIIAWALLVAAFFWVVYMALEPLIRRRWPGRIISWTRLLAGDFRDPMVGRDLLIGALFGVGAVLWGPLRREVPAWLGHPPNAPYGPGFGWLEAGSFLSFLGDRLLNGLLVCIVTLFVILILSLILRRAWLAFVIGGAIGTVLLFSSGRDQSVIDLVFIAIGVAVFTIFPLWRYGLLAAVSSFGLFNALIDLPITTNFTAWYASIFLMYLALLVALAVYGFYTSLAGQKPFAGKFLEE